MCRCGAVGCCLPTYTLAAKKGHLHCSPPPCLHFETQPNATQCHNITHITPEHGYAPSLSLTHSSRSFRFGKHTNTHTQRSVGENQLNSVPVLLPWQHKTSPPPPPPSSTRETVSIYSWVCGYSNFPLLLLSTAPLPSPPALFPKTSKLSCGIDEEHFLFSVRFLPFDGSGEEWWGCVGWKICFE